MKNIVNEKPTYAELEAKVSKHDDDCKTAFFIIVILAVLAAFTSVGWMITNGSVSYQREVKDEYFNKWRACIIKRETTPIDVVDAVLLKKREDALSKNEYDFRLKQIKWEAQMQVEEAKLGLQQERLILEREHNQMIATGKVIKSAK